MAREIIACGSQNMQIRHRKCGAVLTITMSMMTGHTTAMMSVHMKNNGGVR